jgi:predicted enzyme related to lactoylglutathione lyase
MRNPIDWFEIYVEDMNRAKKFYETVFKVKLMKLEGTEHDMWGFPMEGNTYGATGALIHMDGFPTGQNSIIIYFKCENCAVEADAAIRAGGQIEKAKMSIGQYGHIALILDTEGNMIGLHSME